MTLPDAYAESVRACTWGSVWFGIAAVGVGAVGVRLPGFVGGVLLLVSMILLCISGGLLFAAALGGAP